MTDPNEHPEQDPAEGSRETIERDLARKENKADERLSPDHRLKGVEAGWAAAEPSPGI